MLSLEELQKDPVIAEGLIRAAFSKTRQTGPRIGASLENFLKLIGTCERVNERVNGRGKTLKYGASEGTRTLDLRFTKPMLYQLSYAGLRWE